MGPYQRDDISMMFSDIDVKNSEDFLLLEDSVQETETKSLWVFGYGSLCWRPGFKFDKAVVGHIKGFSRKFWQGNHVHRGTKEKPGRVATLIEDKHNSVYGIAFSISGEAAISYLSQRECKLGGYETKFATFYPPRGAPISNILLYVATPNNPSWLGDAPLSIIAEEISQTKGICGHNVEYLLRLADFMRRHCPEAEDRHLFSLEREVRGRIVAKRERLDSLMGDGKDCVRFKRVMSAYRFRDEGSVEVVNFRFASEFSSKRLLCLDI